MTQEEVELITPEDIYDKLLSDIAVHETASEKFIANFNFYGRTLKEHSDSLWIEIPKQMTPEEFREVFAQIATNIQIASHFYSVSNTIYNSITEGGSTKKSDLITAIARSYENKQRRRPGADVISSMADSYLKDTASVRTAAKIVKDFWKERVTALVEVRKSMEQYGISMHSEMKHLGGNT